LKTDTSNPVVIPFLARVLSWATVFALLNVISLCPVLAASMPPTSSCCNHSKGHQIPCTESSANNCPYVLLEKGKAEQGLDAFALAVMPTAIAAKIDPQYWFSSPTHPRYYKDSSSSYLLLRVLRI
jgi:hypothetical protein